METIDDPKKSEGDKSEEEEEEDDDDDDEEAKNEECLKELMMIIDNNYEEKSKKTNLTVWNVKNIIYQVITNENVRVMFRNQLERGKLKEKLHEAIFEPKMTRSKLKEVMKSGQMPLPWSITPSPKSKTLMDINFEEEEEEDDEEYAPSKDELNNLSEDEESISSSRASDCGSPFVHQRSATTAGSSPEVRRFHLRPGTSRGRFEESLIAPMKNNEANDEDRTTMGPPRTLPIKKLILQHDEESQHQQQEDNNNMIALRTRSKLPLKDTSLTELESKIVDPDVWLEPREEEEETCRPTSPENECWQEFLACLADDRVETSSYCFEEDEDTNDPEFNFLGEEDLLAIDKEEIRCDKGVQIPKKEVKSLMDEFRGESWGYDESEDFQQFSLLGDEDFDQLLQTGSHEETGRDEIGIERRSLAPNFGPYALTLLAAQVTRDGPDEGPESSVGREVVLVMSETEKLQLRVQLMQHVQLLAQTFICSSHDSSSVELRRCSETSRQLLEELHDFSNKFSPVHEDSFFSIPTLPDAMQLTSMEFEASPDDSPATNEVELNYKQMEAIANSRAFPYHSLLPKIRLTPNDGPKAPIFCKSEDNLLAMGMNQFGHLSNQLQFRFIKELMLPARTESQLITRMHNLKRNTSLKYENPVKYLLKHKKLPQFEQSLNLLRPRDIIPPSHKSPSLLPNWFHRYENIRQSKLPKQEPVKKIVERKNISKLISNNDKGIQPNPAPIIIVQVQPANATNLYVPYNASSPSIIISQLPAPHMAVMGQSLLPGVPVVQILPSPSPSVSLLPVPSLPEISAVPSAGLQIQPPANQTSQSSASNANDSVLLSPSSTDGCGSLHNRPNQIVTFAGTPTKQSSPQGADGNRNEVLPDDGTTSETKTVDNASKEPFIVLSHDQLKALGVKIDEFNYIAPGPTDNLQTSVSSNLFSQCSIEEKLVVSTPIESSCNVSNSKRLNFSFSSEFLKTFGSSLAESSPRKEGEPEGEKSTTSGVRGSRFLSNRTVSFHLTGDISLESGDAVGFHELEEFSGELSRMIGRTMGSEDSLLRLGDSQMGDLSAVSPFKESDIGVSSTFNSSTNSCIRNLFLELGNGNKTISLSSALEYFSHNLVSSTPVLKETSKTTKNSAGVDSTMLHPNGDESDKKVTFNEAKCSTNVKSSDLLKNNGQNVTRQDENVADDNADDAIGSDRVEDGTKIVLTADLENVDPAVGTDGRELLEMELPDQNKTLYTPKKFSVNEYESIKKIYSPAVSSGTVTPTSREDDMSPDTKRQSLKTIAQLELLVSPPTLPNEVLHPSTPLNASFVTPCRRKTMGEINSPPFKKRFTNFKPKQLDFGSFDGADDRKNAIGVTKAIDKPRLRSVAPKPPFIQITGDLVKAKKPLGRKKNRSTPIQRPVARIQPKVMPPSEVPDVRPEETPCQIPLEEETATDEDALIAELMNASTTIDLDKKATAQLLERQRAHKLKEKQEMMTSLMDEKLLESDPLRRRRDMLYAESYMARVKERFKDRPDAFSKFKDVLYRFVDTLPPSTEKNDASQEHKKLYEDLRETFKDHPDLLSDYAGFLPLDQAVLLGCFVSSLEFEKARIFMTKLEKYFAKRPQTFHRCLKVLKDCRHGAISEEEMKCFISKLIKNNSHLLDEFSWFFPNERPLQSQKHANFEEIDLSQERDLDFNPQFERIELPVENQESFGTTSCICTCHQNGMEFPLRRSRHCSVCIYKVQPAGKQSGCASGNHLTKGRHQSEDKTQKHAQQDVNNHKDPSKDTACPIDEKFSLMATNSGTTARIQSSKPKCKLSPTAAAKPCRREKSSISRQEGRPKVQFMPVVELVKLGSDKRTTRKKSLNVATVDAFPLKSSSEDTSTEEGKGQRNLRSSKKKACDKTAKAEETDPPGKKKRFHANSSESEMESDCQARKKRMKRSREDCCVLENGRKIDATDDRVIEDQDLSRDVIELPVEIPQAPQLVMQWTRDEDKVLLEACQEYGSNSSTFGLVASALGNKSAEGVKNRFEHLMELYAKMDSDGETEQ